MPQCGVRAAADALAAHRLPARGVAVVRTQRLQCQGACVVLLLPFRHSVLNAHSWCSSVTAAQCQGAVSGAILPHSSHQRCTTRVMIDVAAGPPCCAGGRGGPALQAGAAPGSPRRPHVRQAPDAGAESAQTPHRNPSGSCHPGMQYMAANCGDVPCLAWPLPAGRRARRQTPDNKRAFQI